jgi:O-antigen/teichoic acid export membrane protein
MKKFLLSSGVLALQPFITKLISYFVIPLYTFNLSPEQFGNVEFILAIGVFFKTFISMSMTSTFWKYVNEEDKWDVREVVYNIILISFSLGGIILLPVVIYMLVFDQFTLFNTNLAVYFLSEILSVLYMVSNLVIRSDFSLKKFLIITFSYVVFFIASNYFFIDYLKLKEDGVFYSYLCSAVFVSLSSFLILYNKIRFKVNRVLIRDIVKYSFPLMLTNIVAIVIMFSDRILIRNIKGSYDLGLYSFGFKFGALIKSLVIDVFFIVWNPVRWKIYKNEQGELIFSVFSKILFIVFPLVGFISVILSVWIGELLASNDIYNEGLKIVPLVTFGYIFYGLYYYSVMGLLFKEKTKHIAKIVFICSCFNVAVNILLIYMLGYIGAAIGAFVTYLFMFLYGYFESDKHYSIGKLNILTLSLVLLLIITNYYLRYFKLESK